MIPADDIARLLALAGERGLARLEVALEGFGLVADFPHDAGPGDAPAYREPATIVVTSAAFGSFAARHPAAEHPMVAPGNAVAAGDIIGLLRVEALYRPIRATVPGIVRAVRVAEGAFVGYGDPVFEIEPFAQPDPV